MRKEIKIVPFYRPVLYRKAKKVDSYSDVMWLAEEMKRVAKEDNGVGLAAPQVGRSVRLIVVTDGEGGFRPYINPVIKKKSVQRIMVKEGCLSLSGVWCDVERAAAVVVQAEDEKGRLLELEARGVMAVVFQHEIDHLNGRLFISGFDLKTKVRLFLRHVFHKKEKSS